ncbi:MAG TPA: YfhO family protein, partial [Anaerolineae bacterium]|nr:YfhO family protein [Anaerolineae bacterium]
YIVAEDRGEVLELLRDEGFDPATQVILEEQPLIDSTGTAMTGGESQVDVVEYGPSRVIMEASLHHEGLVVLSEVYYPGWKALVDGVEREIYRANYAFRAVPVESGSHHVELVYDPPSVKTGLGLSACALAVIVGSSCWLLVKRARVRAPDPLEAAKHEG